MDSFLSVSIYRLLCAENETRQAVYEATGYKWLKVLV